MLALDPQTALVVGAFGQSFATHDAGQTWAPFRPSEEDLHLNTLALTPDGTLVLAGQARAFLASRDGGRTFTAWSPDLTTAVSKLLVAPDGALFAFGEAGVTRLPAP